MDVMVLIDSFKGSMTSMEAGNAARDGVLRVYPHANVTVRPLADGGEGTTDALIEGLGGRKVELSVTGPMGSWVKAYYGILADEKTVVMEMAQAAGITLVEEAQRNPGKATTYGVGEMMIGMPFRADTANSSSESAEAQQMTAESECLERSV